MKGGWILKSEPSEYSIRNLAEQVIGRWDGVRNYQARNFLREMTVGEKLYFYHSNCAKPGIYGSMIVHKAGYPDPTALERSSKYFDAKATADKNPWTSIDVRIDEVYAQPLTLTEIKELPLGECRLTAKGNRLSVMPITADQVQIIETEIRKKNPVSAAEDITRQDTQPLENETSIEDSKPSKGTKRKQKVDVEEEARIQGEPRSTRRKTKK